MIDRVVKAGLLCNKCDAELIILDEHIFCQMCKDKIKPGDEE